MKPTPGQVFEWRNAAAKADNLTAFYIALCKFAAEWGAAETIKRLSAGVSVEPVGWASAGGLLHIADCYTYLYPREREGAGVAMFTLSQLQTSVAAARVQENERIAHWYEVAGYYLDEEDVPDAIRALLGKEAT